MNTFVDAAYPQLSRDKALLQLRENSGLEPLDLVRTIPSLLQRPDFEFRPLATRQIQPSSLLEARENIILLLSKVQAGEDRIPGVDQRVTFDRRLTAVVLNIFPMSAHEAATENVWSYLTLRLLPDVANWRFENKEHAEAFERYLGKPRNTFKRLWWRAYMLGPDIASQLGENDHVQMFERGMSIGSNKEIVRGMGKFLIDNAAHFQERHLSSSKVIIEASKQIRRKLAVISFESLDEISKIGFVTEAMEVATEHVSKSKN